jgi:hypothetical protein
MPALEKCFLGGYVVCFVLRSPAEFVIVPDSHAYRQQYEGGAFPGREERHGIAQIFGEDGMCQ